MLKTISIVKDKMGTKLPFLIIFLFILLSCETVHQKLDPEIYYKRDMLIKYMGANYSGTVVLPLSNKFPLEFVSAGDMDLFTFTTCHRLHTQEDAGGFLSKKNVKYMYVPDPVMEQTYACPVQIAGYDTNGTHSWGFIDLETRDARLPAKIKCNGEAYNSNGVTICQSKMGLMQSITFDIEVVFSPEAQEGSFCKAIKYTTKDNKEFIYEMPRRECVYVWTEKAAPNREHRLSTIGFEQVIIRK